MRVAPVGPESVISCVRAAISSAVIDRAWWDFDAGERGDIDQVKRDVHTLLGRLSGDVRLVATGRGFHIHQMFSRTVEGTAFHDHLARYQRKMAVGLPTLDGVGFPAKLTRIPDTYNVTRKRWAVNVSVEAFLSDPMGYPIPTTPQPQNAVYDPFRGRETTSGFDIVLWANDNPAPKVEMADFVGDVGNAVTNTVSQRYGVAPRVDDCGTADLPIGMTLYDVKEEDENGEKLIYNPRKAAELQAVVSGQAVPLVTKGLFLYDYGTASTAIAGLNARVGAGGTIVTGGAGHVIGRWLGSSDTNGHALLALNIGLNSGVDS